MEHERLNEVLCNQFNMLELIVKVRVALFLLLLSFAVGTFGVNPVVYGFCPVRVLLRDVFGALEPKLNL